MLDTQIARGHKVGINEAFYVRNVEPGERERPYYRNRSCRQLYSFPKKKRCTIKFPRDLSSSTICLEEHALDKTTIKLKK